MWACFWCLARSPHSEHQNVPLWACSGARSPLLHLDHQNEPVWVRSGVQEPLPISTTRPSPCGFVLVLGNPSPSPTPERARVGAFWCSVSSPLPIPRLDHQNEPVWVSGVREPPLFPPHLEHQNEPMWARSGARAPTPSLSLVSNTRTSPHGLVLMFGHLPSPLPRLPSHIPHLEHQKYALLGVFLLSAMPLPLLCCSACLTPLPSSRTPQMRPDRYLFLY